VPRKVDMSDSRAKKPETDDDEDDCADDTLALDGALAWIATRNAEFVYGLSEEWGSELHQIAKHRGVEMKFAKTARDAWYLLREAISSGRVRATGVFGEVSEPWFRGEGAQLTADVVNDLDLGIESNLTLVSCKLSASPKQWSRISVSLCDLQTEFPIISPHAQAPKPRRNAKRHYAGELLAKHFPNGQQGRSIKEIVTVIKRAAKGVTMHEKTITRAIKDKWMT
jgi:hypothetical protein